jgi:hypothetical protein
MEARLVHVLLDLDTLQASTSSGVPLTMSEDGDLIDGFNDWLATLDPITEAPEPSWVGLLALVLFYH